METRGRKTKIIGQKNEEKQEQNEQNEQEFKEVKTGRNVANQNK